MNLRKALGRLLIGCATISAVPTISNAQLLAYGKTFNTNGEKKNYFFKGLTLSYFYSMPFTADIKHYFSGYNSTGQLIKERQHFETLDAKPVIYGAISSYIPMVYTGERSMVALDLGAEYNGYTANIRNITADDNFNYEAEYAQAHIGVSVGVSYKFGSLASYAKQDKFSYFAGAAVIPSYTMINYGNIVSTGKFTVIPMLQGGIGLFAGVQWTFYGKYYPMGFGKEMVLGSNLAGMDRFGSSSRFLFKTSDFLQLGVGVNLFSGKWDKYRW